MQIGKGVIQECCLSPILFNLYNECLTKEAPNGLGDFNIGGQIIQTVKYADDLVPWQKLHSTRRIIFLPAHWNLRKKLVKCYIWSMALYGAETWTLRAADQNYLESFEMWCWRRMEISWTDHVRNEEVLLRVNEQRNILHEI